MPHPKQTQSRRGTGSSAYDTICLPSLTFDDANIICGLPDGAAIDSCNFARPNRKFSGKPLTSPISYVTFVTP